MRADGVLSVASGLAPDSHVCWVYDEPESFAVAGRRYLADGLARGDRLLCVGDAAVEAALAGVEPFADAEELLARGALRLTTVDDAYLRRGAVVPEEQLAFYAAATSEALAAGYAGLRVLAEATALAGDPDRRAAMLRWEHLADDFMASGAGMSALCAYRRDAIGEVAAAEVESVHPQVRARDGAAPFRVFFDDRRLALAGVVDAFGADRLLRTLTSSHVRDPEVVLDLGRLEFVDVRGCTVVARYARALGRDARELRVVAAPPMFRRVWHVLGYDALPNATVTGAAS